MNRLDPARVPIDRATLIEASAGTGKTYTIATLFVRLLLEQQLLVSQVLVVTYTRAATSELRDRIRRRVIETLAALDHGTDDDNLAALLAPRADQREADRAALSQALRDFDEAAIFTIHGFCQHALREWAFESHAPFELELTEDQRPLLREVALDYFARVAYAADPELVAALLSGRGKPEDLAQLADKGVRDPQLDLLPTAVALRQPPAAPFQQARERAAKLWADDRTAILHLLSRSALHRGHYSEAEIRTSWAPELDRLATREPLELPAFLPKLRQTKLEDETNKGGMAPRHSFFVAVEELCKQAAEVKAALDQRVLSLRLGLVRYAREETGRRRSERSAHSFDDLLHALHDALAGPGGETLARQIASRHKAALIDEFQDTDPVQYGIFQRIYAANGAPLFLIGDPKQAIYGFRGADVFAYLTAARACAAARYTLDVNYRSDPSLLQALATLFGRARRPFLLEEIGFEAVQPEPRARERLAPAEPALQLLFVPRDARTQEKKVISKGWADGNGQGSAQLPELIAYEVLRLLQSGATVDRGSDPGCPEPTPIKPRHIAVLCRTNAQARAVQHALAELSVPTVLEGDSSVFDQETAEELARVLWAIAEPADRRKRGAALSTAILGVPGEALHRMQNEEAELEPWLERIARWSQLWHERGFVQMAQRMLHEAAVQPRLLARSDGERRLTDLLHLFELLHRASVEQHLGPLSLLHWFAEMRNDPEARTGIVADAEQMRLEHDEHAVKLTTVHRSKGLEHEVVFCPYLWGGPVGDEKDVRFHDREDGDRVKLDLGSPDHARHKALAEREDLAERLRLLYVALTRAKHRCYLVWGHFYGSDKSALGYLLHQGEVAKLEEPIAIAQRISKMTDRELLSELEALRAAGGGSIALREIGFERPAPYEHTESVGGALAARARSRELTTLPRMTSFSRLIADAETGAGAQLPPEESRDHDAAESGPPAGAAERGRPELPVVLHAFPTGSRPGSLIHSVFEHIDFRREDPRELGAEVERQLNLYGVDAALHRDALIEGMDRALRTPLASGDAALRLADVARGDRVDELEFTLGGRRGAAAADLGQLAEIFAQHRAPACDPDYGTRLRALGPTPGAPFLKGFIDLVFRANGRFYIVDYKSNWLGAHARDYAQPQLVQAMREHHYFLQYHLYTLALHRYLQLRVPDYDYARHFGGVYYLFVRGMAPEHAPGAGVFFDRPELALIDALAAALAATEAA